MMLLARLLGSESQFAAVGCCAKNTKCLRGGAGDGEGEIHEYAPNTQAPGVEVLVDDPDPLLAGASALPRGPTERTVPTYDVAETQMLRGEPIFSGRLLRLTTGNAAYDVQMSLHVNGFSCCPATPSMGSAPPFARECRIWSPFSLVERCDVKAGANTSKWAVFSLTTFQRRSRDVVYYFAAVGEEAEAERERWTTEIAQAIGKVVQSLFPRHTIAVQPVPGKAATSTRIMAGYLLLQSGAAGMVSVFYCELQAYCLGRATLALYKDEWCEQQVTDIPILDAVAIGSCDGVYCTIFALEHHRFCARTVSEKELWLRAVTNVKVKLMFSAPDPTTEELAVFRDAVHERVEELLPPSVAVEARPILSELPRLPPSCPQGDATEDPDPVDEGAPSEVTPPSPTPSTLGLREAARANERSGDPPDSPPAWVWSPSPGGSSFPTGPPPTPLRPLSRSGAAEVAAAAMAAAAAAGDM